MGCSVSVMALMLMGMGHGVITVPVALKGGALTKVRKQALCTGLWQNDALCYWKRVVGF